MDRWGERDPVEELQQCLVPDSEVGTGFRPRRTHANHVAGAAEWFEDDEAAGHEALDRRDVSVTHAGAQERDQPRKAEFLVDVETDISNGLPSFTTVGLPQGAVKEGRERVGASIANSDFLFPSRRRSGRVWKEATPLTLRYTLIMYDTCRTLVL